MTRVSAALLLLKVADNDGQGQRHGESSADGTESAHQFADPADRVDVPVPQ